jgi:hypothetical protein
MTHNADPLEPAEDDARGWREFARRLQQRLRRQEEEIARLRAIVKRKESVEVGQPVPSIAKARKPRPKY